MQAPKKRDSKILSDLNALKDPLESKRTRASMVLAAKIIEGRKAKGWNNVQLAEALGKKPSVITRWLSGTHNFTSDTLSDIQEVLGIKLLASDIDNELAKNERAAKQPFAEKVEFNILIGTDKVSTLEVHDQNRTSFQVVSYNNELVSVSGSLSQALTGYNVTSQ